MRKTKLFPIFFKKFINGLSDKLRYASAGMLFCGFFQFFLIFRGQIDGRLVVMFFIIILNIFCLIKGHYATS